MKKPLAVLILAVILALAGWAGYSPYRTVHRMQEAAAAKNYGVLAQDVDFPAVKEDMKARLRAKVAGPDAAKTEKEDSLAGLGTRLAMAFIEPMVDTLVTPETVAMMLKGVAPPRRKGEPPPAQPDEGTETVMRYEGLNRFVVTARPRQGSERPVILVLERRGLATWKLASVILPD